MAATGLCYLAGQVVSEYEVDLSSPRTSKRPLEEALTALRKGALLLKHGRHGKPKVHFFRVTACDNVLKWRSASGSVKQVRLRSVTEVVAGQTTEVFKRYPLRDQACSFSLHYRDDEGSSRTLDLTCATEQQFELWLNGLRVVTHWLRTAVVPPPSPSPGGAGVVGSSGMSPADLARWAASTDMQSGSRGAPPPALEHVPCDLLAWGAAQRAPISLSVRSSNGLPEDCWQHRNLPGPAPGGLLLDAYRAAVGRKHAAVVTATGALYTWGEGRGGKLGLGHDQDQPQPQRLKHGLEGQCVVAVACGDDCTAALTEDGEVYMWGRLHVDTRPQLVPVHVRGDLRSRRVVQISCGPFHCAAVSADGQLFTWGEGFGGKLGHGDQGNRTHPALVQAFVGRQVLEAACGVWHTAAIVVPTESGSPYSPCSPVKGESSAADPPPAGADGGGPASTTTSPPRGASHHRNNSTSSAFSEASVCHEGQGGSLYTWGGVNESVAFGSSEKRDSNKGCLGHGEADLYRGQLLPTRVGGALESRQVRHVAAGSHLTVAVTTGGRVFQMGVTGATASKYCPWEGATLPELVRGQLAGVFVDEVACGMHHVVAVGRPVDRRQGRPADHAPRVTFAWGRGSEGQLGVRSFDDSATPLLVESMKGRNVVQVTCGGSNTMAVCEHDTRRFEPDSKEEADSNMQALTALLSDPKPGAGTKQLRIQEPGAEGMLHVAAREGSDGSGGRLGGIMRRSFTTRGRSFAGGASVSDGSAALVPYGSGQAPDLARLSSGSVRSGGGGSSNGGGGSGRRQPPSISQMYSTLMNARKSQKAQQAQQRVRASTDRAASVSLPSSYGGGGYVGYGGGGGGDSTRVLSLGSPYKSSASGAHAYGGGYGTSAGGGGGAGGFGRRSTYAGAGGAAGERGGGIALSSQRSFTMSAAQSYGGRSDLSSLSSWQHRAHSDDGLVREAAEPHEVDSLGGGARGGGSALGARLLSTSDMGGLDAEGRSGSSNLVALQEELAEKNRIIEKLQLKLEKVQRQAQPSSAAARSDADDRLRESVRMSAGAFREAQMPSSPLHDGSSTWRRSRSSPAPSARFHHSNISPSNSARTAGGVGAGGGTEQEEVQREQLHTMEQFLAKKEAHLQGQQQQLEAWAKELQRREQALADAAARLQGGSAGGAGIGRGQHTAAVAAVGLSPESGGGTPTPAPILSDSPVLPGEPAGPAGYSQPAAAGPAGALPAQLQRIRQEEAAATGASSSSGSAGGLPGSPAAPGEWTEEFEQGVFLTFTTEGGAKKLKRIRFNRSLFTADGAKEWYETNKHRLAQPTGMPRMPTPTAGAAAAAEGGAFDSAPGSRPGSTLGATWAPSLPDHHHPHQQQAAAAGPAGGDQQHAATAAAVGSALGSSASSAPVSPGKLRYRQTSTNLSFDARELAGFHERLSQLAAAQQGQQGAPGPQHTTQQQHRLSRLSQVGPTSAAAAAEGVGGREQGWESESLRRQYSPTPGSPALSGRSSPTAPALRSGLNSRQGSGIPGELGAVRSSTALYGGGGTGTINSGSSSPIPAGSRASSPLSKQRSVASGTLSKQLSSPKSELARAAAKEAQQAALFTPRAPLDKQHSVAVVAAAAAAGMAAQEGSPLGSAGLGLAGSDGSHAGSAGGAKNVSSSFSGTIGRIRRTLTGSGGSGGGGGAKQPARK